MDLNSDGKLSVEEVYEHVKGNDDGSKTPEELQEEAQQLFDSYNLHGGMFVKMPEMWRVVAPDIRKEAALKKEHEDEYYNAHAYFAELDKDHDNVVSANDIMHVIEYLDFFDFMGKSPITDVIYWDEIYEKYILFEHEALKRFGNVWMGAFNANSEDPVYSATLADFNIEEVGHYLGVENEIELAELFTAIDKTDDGIIDFWEACRYYIADYDVFCKKYRNSGNWWGLVTHWQENGMP